MNQLFSIEGKVAIITGGGGVLGGSIAKSFVQAGAKVVALDIRQRFYKALKHLFGQDKDAFGFQDRGCSTGTTDKKRIFQDNGNGRFGRWISFFGYSGFQQVSDRLTSQRYRRPGGFFYRHLWVSKRYEGLPRFSFQWAIFPGGGHIHGYQGERNCNLRLPAQTRQV